MSEYQGAWVVLWEYAAARVVPMAPFEIDEILPKLAEAYSWEAANSRQFLNMLLTELQRLPEGERYFTREGNAIVPLPEYERALKSGKSAADVYPFEL